MAWRPKLTPYRFVVLTTTVALGIAKAIVTQNGGYIISTTLEWIAGTFLSLIFFALSAYDSRESVPWYLIWLFKPDCMDLVWKFLALFSIERPEYISDEVPSDSTDHPMSANGNIITAYRILVCATVTASGMSKATLGYLDYSTAVTWMDWAIAVPVTALLYVLGLYEYNSSDLWPGFFYIDQSNMMLSVYMKMVYIVCTLLWAAWTSVWMYALYVVSMAEFSSLLEDRSTVTLEVYTKNWRAWLFKLFVQVMLVPPIIHALFLPWEHVDNKIEAMSGEVQSLFRAIFGPITKALHSLFPSIANNPLPISTHTSGVDNNNLGKTKPFLIRALVLAIYLSIIILMLFCSMIGYLSSIFAMFKFSGKEEEWIYFPGAVLALSIGHITTYAAYRIGASMIATFSRS